MCETLADAMPAHLCRVLGDWYSLCKANIASKGTGTFFVLLGLCSHFVIGAASDFVLGVSL